MSGCGSDSAGIKSPKWVSKSSPGVVDTWYEYYKKTDDWDESRAIDFKCYNYGCTTASNSGSKGNGDCSQYDKDDTFYPCGGSVALGHTRVQCCKGHTLAQFAPFDKGGLNKCYPDSWVNTDDDEYAMIAC